MSIKLKDTIYDLVNKSTTSTKATQDGSGNVIVNTYLKKTGDYMSGDLNMMNSNQHNSDQYIKFKYSTTDLDGYSWRIGYTGTGNSNENRLVIQNNSNGSGGSTGWENILTFGLFDKTAIFTNIPKVGSTKVSLEGHTHSQYLTSLPSHNHDGSYLSLSNTQTPVVTNSQSGIVCFKSTNTVEAGIRIFMGDINKGGLWWISSSSHGMVIYNNTCSGYLGIKDNGTPHFNGNTLLHSNNWSSYAAPASHSHPYLPLTGGTLTGILTINDNQYISSPSSSAILAVGNNSVFTGATNDLSTIVGSISLPLILRSNENNLTHYRIDKNTHYTILDSFNYTDYAATAGHTHSGYAASNHSHSNYSTTDHSHGNYYDYNISRSANTVLAAPNGSAGSATFRALVAADIPNISAAKITSGTLAVARGGTGQTTLINACWDLLHSLTEATATPYDSSYYISQDTGGLKGYYRRTHLALYNYIKGKLDSVYAAKSHSHSYLPLSGGNISGHIYLTGSNTGSSTANTSQIIFGTSSSHHVCISSNENVLVINPTASSTDNQVVLRVDGTKSSFLGGIDTASLSIGGEAITFTT